MDCPQCGAQVPSDDAFCGKCGYAMRENAPERVDQSRIRVHEEPVAPPPASTSSPDHARKATMMGMPAVPPRRSGETPHQPQRAPAPPTEISAARERARKRVAQKTMLGIPRSELGPPPEASDDESVAGRDADGVVEVHFARPEHRDAQASGRERAQVRYDSSIEAFPTVQRRRQALRGVAVLVLLAGAWFAYRYFTLNG